MTPRVRKFFVGVPMLVCGSTPKVPILDCGSTPKVPILALWEYSQGTYFCFWEFSHIDIGSELIRFKDRTWQDLPI